MVLALLYDWQTSDCDPRDEHLKLRRCVFVWCSRCIVYTGQRHAASSAGQNIFVVVALLAVAV